MYIENLYIHNTDVDGYQFLLMVTIRMAPQLQSQQSVMLHPLLEGTALPNYYQLSLHNHLCMHMICLQCNLHD